MAPSIFVKIARVVLLSAVLAGCGQKPQAVQDPLLVVTTHGPVRGSAATSGADVRAFLGIPFAAPPTGALRWKPPQPPAAWQAAREVKALPAGCLQPREGPGLPWTPEFRHQGEISEDCLYLNVWSPAVAGGPRPVLFFIYGGGFTEGSINVPLYDGAALARKGVIVVAANYRVGPVGFLSLAELEAESPHGSSNNYGLLDQIAALQWVHDNVRAFGGDPANVTIAGQSAGAVSAYLLTRSPLAVGLFHRAILASGPGALAAFDPLIAQGAVRRADAQRDGMKFLGQAGATSLAQLRAMDGSRLPPPGTPDPRSQGIRIWPVADGWVLPADAQGALAAGQASDVPLLIGMNADETSMSPGYAAVRDQQRAANLASMRQFLSLHAASSKQPAYVYYFQHPIPWPEHPQFGAYHSADLPYVFDNLAMVDRPWTGADRALATAASASWVNFATTGKPGGAPLADWPAYTPEAPQWMVFADQPQLRDSPEP